MDDLRKFLRVSRFGLLYALWLPCVQGAQEVFTDDFERPDGPVGGWTAYQGAWSISGGKMTTTGSGVESWIWLGAPALKAQGDLELNVQVTFGPPAADGVGRHGGFAFFASEPTYRYGPTFDGYTIDWIDRAADHGLRLIRVDNAAQTMLGIGASDYTDPPSSWTVQVDGDYIRILADGNVVLEVADSTYREGYIGSWAWTNGTRIYVDELQLTYFPVYITPCFTFNPNIGAAPLTVTFDASCTTSLKEIAAYEWDFGDGETGTGQTATHEYKVGGSYMITLTVRDVDGNEDTATNTILVFDSAPSFEDNFDRPDGPVDGWTVYSGAWNIANGLLTSTTAGAEHWAWAGDPPYSFPANFTLTFFLNFAVRPPDDVGRHGGVMFCATRPTQRWDAGMSGYTIDWIDRVADHGIRLIRVDSGVHTTLDIGARDPAVYPDPPTFWQIVVEGSVIRVFGDDELLLEARDAKYRRGLFGIWAYSNGQVIEFDDMQVTSPSLSPCFQVLPKENLVVGAEFTFDATCSSATGTPIATYAWDFGDGSRGQGPVVQHAYAAPGYKTVKLTVTTEGGLRDSTERVVQVAAVLDSFEDNFDRPDGPPSGWSIYAGDWSLKSGALEVNIPGGAPEAWIYAGDPAHWFEGIGAIEFDIDFLQGAPADPAAVGRHGGVFICAASPTPRYSANNGYGIDWIDRNTDHGYRIYRFDNGVQTVDFVAGTPGEVDPGLHWRIELDGDIIRLIVDGEIKAEVTDSTYRPGHFAFWAYPGDAATGWVQWMSVDNVKIEKAGGPSKPQFHRGDANADGSMNITDGIYVLNYLFLGGDTPPCLEAANANDDESINITDGIYILNFLFLGGSEPAPPGPPGLPCGSDPADSKSDLGCESYANC